MSLSDVKRWLKATEQLWPPRKARWLNSDAVKAFQSSYRRYRRGHWKGAKGELLDVVDGDVSGSSEYFSAQRLSKRDSDLTDDQFKDSLIFESREDPLAIRHLHELEKYRRAYRRFRTGADRGAEGEISRLAEHFTRDQLRLLPIAALAQYLGDQRGLFVAADLPVSQFHVHFGAGKLGLGLVLPALVAGGVPFAVLQRPSEAWAPVLQSSVAFIDIIVNEDCITQLRVIRSVKDFACLVGVKESALLSSKATGSKPETSEGSPASFFLHWLKQETLQQRLHRFLVLDPSCEEFFLAVACSFSSALGPALSSTLTCLQRAPQLNTVYGKPSLYGCENDHKALDQLRPVLDDAVQIKECMVDRICSERLVTATKVFVTAEPYPGEIVVRARPPQTSKCPFSGLNVSTPRTYGAYSYLYNRKFLLVNGTHTTFAFMTLRKHCADPADAPGDFPLMSLNDMTPLEKLEVRAWATARCLVLFHSHEIDVIKHTHNLHSDENVVLCLWSYAENAIQRLSSVKDSTKRVLGGGVVNRYETRLKDVLETLEAFDKSVPLVSQLFKYTGFQSMAQLKDVLRLLVLEVECFVTLEPRVTTAHYPMPRGPFDIIPALRYAQGYQRQFGYRRP